MSRRLALLAVLLLLPAVAEACAVCGGDTSTRSRDAFFNMTVMMSLLPLGLVGGGVIWLRRGLGAHLADEFRERDEAGAGASRAPEPGDASRTD